MAASIEEKLYTTFFRADDRPHLAILEPQRCMQCPRQQCTYVCPARCYTPREDGSVLLSHEGCLECGTCRLVCDQRNIQWHYPRGGYGVRYRYG